MEIQLEGIFYVVRPEAISRQLPVGKTKQSKGLDIEQIYGHGSQGGPVPGLSVPAGCRQ
jgi:hypothetical protein